MRINSSELSLSLALHTLETTVIPDPSTDAARNAISNIRLMLLDLLRRQGPGVDFLAGLIKEGEELAHEYQIILGSEARKLPVVTKTPVQQNFDSLVDMHDELTQRLNQLCTQMLMLKGSNPQTGVALRHAAEWERKYYEVMPHLPALPYGEDPVTIHKSPPPLSREFLRDFLRTQRGDSSINVVRFESVPGGYGNQTFFCTLTSKNRQDEEEIVIRKSDGLPIVLSLEEEYNLLRSLTATSLPVAKPLELASNLPGVDGTFYTMSKLSGQMIGKPGQGKHLALSEKLLFRLAELLGQLHSIPLEKLQDFIVANGETSVFQQTIQERHHLKLTYWKEYSRKVEHPPSPYITWIFDWLATHVPEDKRRPVLTHGDFNIHNVLIEDDEVTGLLDWECADFDAPEIDLAYFQSTVTAHMDWNRFLKHYYKHGGPKVNPAALLYCSVYGGLRLALASGRFAISLQSGVNRDIRFINVEQNLLSPTMALGLDVTKALTQPLTIRTSIGTSNKSIEDESVIYKAKHVEAI